MKRQRREHKLLFAGGSGGGSWIEGEIEDNSCPSGTLDIKVDGVGTKGIATLDEVIRCTDRFDWMDGQTAAELVGQLALAGRTYNLTSDAWEWRVWAITDDDGCDEVD